MATYAELVERTRFEAPLTLPAITAGNLAASTGQALRLAYWVADAWRALQMEDRLWRWMRRQVVADVTLAGGVTYTPTQMGVPASTGFTRWWPEGPLMENHERYTVRAYLNSNAGNVWPVRFLRYDTFVARFMTGAQQNGPPRFWSEAPNGDFLVGPPPDQTYKVRADYVKGVQELVLADNTTPDFPAKYHLMIAWRALYEHGSYDAATDTIERARANYNRLEEVLLREQAPRMEINWGALGS